MPSATSKPASVANPSEQPFRSGTGQEGALEQGLQVLRRRKLVIVQAVIVVPLIALLLSLAQDDQYTATATLLFRQAPEGLSEGDDTGFVDPSREAATNDELVALPVVAERAAAELGGVGSDTVLNSVTVDSGGEADIARISATTGSPEAAADMANAYGRAYIAFRRDADRSQVQQAIDLVNASIAAIPPGDADGPQIAVLQERLERLKLAQALQTGKAELVQPAEPPDVASAPRTRRNVMLGLVLGALLGCGLAALLERVDRRVRTVEELEELFGAPILARIPRSRTLANRDQAQRDMAQTPEGEAFRILRTNLRYYDVDSTLRSLLIASPSAGDGKSTVAHQLATTMAEMGDDVILVEADLHKGSLPRDVLPRRSGDGLSSVLAGVPLERALKKVPIDPSPSKGDRFLTVLPSGPVPPNPSELLESERMRTLLAELQERFDMVVVDSPALGIVGDALALVPQVSGVLVVSGLGQTTRDAARDFRKQLALLNIRPVGVVANFTEVDRGAHSYYYRSQTAGRT